jgi:hypothetical protein
MYKARKCIRRNLQQRGSDTSVVSCRIFWGRCPPWKLSSWILIIEVSEKYSLQGCNACGSTQVRRRFGGTYRPLHGRKISQTRIPLYAAQFLLDRVNRLDLLPCYFMPLHCSGDWRQNILLRSDSCSFGFSRNFFLSELQFVNTAPLSPAQCPDVARTD